MKCFTVNGDGVVVVGIVLSGSDKASVQLAKFAGDSSTSLPISFSLAAEAEAVRPADQTEGNDWLGNRKVKLVIKQADGVVGSGGRLVGLTNLPKAEREIRPDQEALVLFDMTGRIKSPFEHLKFDAGQFVNSSPLGERVLMRVARGLRIEVARSRHITSAISRVSGQSYFSAIDMPLFAVSFDGFDLTVEKLS